MGSIYIISAILLWSSLGVIIRLADTPVYNIIFYNTLLAVMIQGTMLLKKDFRPAMPEKKTIAGFLIIGILSVTNSMSFFYSYQNTTIANTILTHYIAPVLVAFLAPFFLKEPLTKRIFLAVVTASVGLWILLGIWPWQMAEFFGRPTKDAVGILSGLLSGVSYALIIIVLRIFAQNYEPLVVSFFQNLAVVIFIAPFIREFPIHAIWVFVLMGVVHSTIAPILYLRGLKEVSANKTAILGYIEPVGAIVFGMIFFSEYPEPTAIFGGLMILYSGYLTLTESKRTGRVV